MQQQLVEAEQEGMARQAQGDQAPKTRGGDRAEAETDNAFRVNT
jgi:hypothetical protein